MAETVTLDRTGDRAVLTLVRPEAGNAFDAAMIEAFAAVVDRLAGMRDLRLVLLRGAGPSFCAGADLGLIRDGLADPETLFARHDAMFRAFTRLSDLNALSLAVVHGPAVGGGAELALACDLRIMADGAWMQFPEAALGIMPGAGGTARLPRLTGYARAIDLLVTGRRLSAAEAARIGLATRVAPADALDTAVDETADALMRAAAQSSVAIKRALRASVDMPLPGALEHCQSAALLLGPTAETARRLKALQDRRGKPSR